MGENKELGKGYWAPAWRELFHKSAPELFGWPELFSPGWALQIFAAPVRPKGFVWLEFYRGHFNTSGAPAARILSRGWRWALSSFRHPIQPKGHA